MNTPQSGIDNINQTHPMKIRTLLITALAALLIPAFASAQEDGTTDETTKQCQKGGKGGPKGKKHKRGQHLKKMDTNQDGQISLDEAEAANAERLLENFAEIDADSDGNITRDEMRAFHEAKRAENGGEGRGASSTDSGSEARSI